MSLPVELVHGLVELGGGFVEARDDATHGANDIGIDGGTQQHADGGQDTLAIGDSRLKVQGRTSWCR